MTWSLSAKLEGATEWQSLDHAVTDVRPVLADPPTLEQVLAGLTLNQRIKLDAAVRRDRTRALWMTPR